MHYYIGKYDESRHATPDIYKEHSRGFDRVSLVNRANGSVHCEACISRLAPGGSIPTHVHAYEKGIYLLEGEVELLRNGEAVRMPAHGYALIPYATPHAFRNRGKQTARYDKIHLFGFKMGAEAYHEERTIEAGVTPVTTDTPFGKLGLSICYDLRFPELYRAMQGVDIIFAPSAFTETTGRAHWETLLRARAIENLAYVVAAAQGGRHENGRETHGDSMIVDPWGVVLDRLPRGAGVVIADIDLARMHDLRRSLPALQHRVIR